MTLASPEYEVGEGFTLDHLAWRDPALNRIVCLAQRCLAERKEIVEARAFAALLLPPPSYRAVCTPRIRVAPLPSRRAACRPDRDGSEPRYWTDLSQLPFRTRRQPLVEVRAQHTDFPVAHWQSRVLDRSQLPCPATLSPYRKSLNSSTLDLASREPAHSNNSRARLADLLGQSARVFALRRAMVLRTIPASCQEKDTERGRLDSDRKHDTIVADIPQRSRSHREPRLTRRAFWSTEDADERRGQTRLPPVP